MGKEKKRLEQITIIDKMKQRIQSRIFLYYPLLLIGSVGLATLIGALFRFLKVPETNIVIVYIFFVVLSMCLVEKYVYLYGVTASLVSTCVFSIFFIEPYFGIAINDPTYFITLLVMSVISIIIGMLITKSCENARRMKEKELEIIQERYRSNLLRAISHDLRTPLAGIMGSSEMIMGTTEVEDARYGIAEGIYQDANWLFSIIENILSLTKLQSGGVMALKRQTEPIEEVVEAAVRLIEKRESDRVIKVDIPEKTLWVSMDTHLMEQVVLNLLDNAIKHTRPGEEISVQVSESEDQSKIYLVVADRGEGIAEKDLDNIFQLFYMSDKTVSDAQKGVGLGLTICETIVKAHNGTIVASNRSDGKGAIFEITLPNSEVEDEG